ncbi:hypothetical protein C2E23DRAFT_402903 [Lenzites betulinus]|nr:hypothetical protein C2E23DRAFT_402903 [Lenzites betulinus]
MLLATGSAGHRAGRSSIRNDTGLDTAILGTHTRGILARGSPDSAGTERGRTTSCRTAGGGDAVEQRKHTV